MNRIYKEDTPINTIVKIRKILSDLNVLNYESFWGNPYKNVFSVRIESFDTEGRFGTNGKGKNRLYALASGYAEYMERIQNGLLTGTSSLNRFFLNKIKTKTGFYFYPDEKFLSESEFNELPLEYLFDIFGSREKSVIANEIKLYFKRLNDNGYPGVLAVPYYNVRDQKLTYLPFNINLMLTGSNGMSAGNSVYEGVFQGICELLERYAASIVYFEQLTPPTIPMSFLKKFPEEFFIIEEIISSGYKVIVKDFSCNKHLPVIGVIIVKEDEKKYRLNVGADTCFYVALSRALTEIHQGIKDKSAFESVLLPIPQEEHPYFLNDDKVSMLQRSIELRKFTINNSGVFPFSLFQNKESYSFNSNTFNHKPTYKEEVDSLLNIILDNNDNLYIRDVSFLGFPSYHIYIPKISPIGRKTTQVDRENVNLNTNVRTDEIEDLFFPFESLISDNTKLNKLVEIIASPNQKDISEVKMCDLLKLEFKAEFYWSTIPASFFLVLFYYILKDYKSSVSYLDIFLESTKNEKDPYYQNIRKYLNYLSLGQDNEYIKKEIPSEIINTFKDNSSLFANIGIPHCPDCGKCLLKDNCLTFGKVDYSIRINNKMKENFIDQNNLKILKIN